VRHPTAQQGEEHLLYLPKHFDPSKGVKYPVILWLHGFTGIADPPYVLNQGLPAALKQTHGVDIEGPVSNKPGEPRIGRRQSVTAARPIELEEPSQWEEFEYIVLIPIASPRIKYDESLPNIDHSKKRRMHETIDHGDGYVEHLDGVYLEPCQHWPALRPRLLSLVDHALACLCGDTSRVYTSGMSACALKLAAAESTRFTAYVA